MFGEALIKDVFAFQVSSAPSGPPARGWAEQARRPSLGTGTVGRAPAGTSRISGLQVLSGALEGFTRQYGFGIFCKICKTKKLSAFFF